MSYAAVKVRWFMAVASRNVANVAQENGELYILAMSPWRQAEDIFKTLTA